MGAQAVSKIRGCVPESASTSWPSISSERKSTDHMPCSASTEARGRHATVGSLGRAGYSSETDWTLALKGSGVFIELRILAWK